MEVSKVKIINEWDTTDTSKDHRIEPLIPHYAQVASEYCHRAFVEPYPAKVEEFIARMIAYNHSGLASRSMGSVSYSWDTSSEDKIYALIRPFRKVNWGGSHVHN